MTTTTAVHTTFPTLFELLKEQGKLRGTHDRVDIPEGTFNFPVKVCIPPEEWNALLEIVPFDGLIKLAQDYLDETKSKGDQSIGLRNGKRIEHRMREHPFKMPNGSTITLWVIVSKSEKGYEGYILLF